MLIRSRQLACLLVLLSTLGLAAGAAGAAGPAFRGTAVEALLYRQAIERKAVEQTAEAKLPRRLSAESLQLPATAHTALHAPQQMSAAAAHSISARALQAIPALQA